MTRLLLAVVFVELVAVGLVLNHHVDVVRPPLPNAASLDAATLAELRATAAGVRPAGDWSKLGESYLAVGLFPEAEACWRQATAIEPTAAEHAFKHAFALERLGRIEEANASYQSAIDKKYSRSTDAWYYVGRNHLRLEDAKSAAESFAMAGNLPGARFERALLDARAGRGAEADAEAAKLMAEFPDAYPPVALRIRLALARKEPVGALSDAFARRPRPLPTPFDSEVDWLIGKANGVGHARLFRDAGRDMQAGRAADADAKIREALQARWDPEVADKHAEIAFAQNRRDEALRILSEVVDRGGPTLVSLWRRGQAEAAIGQSEKALITWECAAGMASGPNGRDLLQDLADRHEKLGQKDQAKAYLARSQLAAGIEALDGGRLDEATVALGKATENDPQSAAAWFELGESHRRSNRANEARAAYGRCLKLDPLYGRAVRALALLGQ